jgi:glycosyltransferase 2 family protein
MTGHVRRNQFLRLLPGIVLSVIAIIALIWQVNWRQTLQAWASAHLWVIAPAVAFIAAAMFTRAVAWRLLMRNTVPMRKAFWILNVSYMLNAILPFRLGDIARAYLVSRRDRGTAEPSAAGGSSPAVQPPLIDAGTALSAVAVERVFDLILSFVFLLLAFPILSGKVGNQWTLLSSFGLAVVGFLGLLLLGAGSARITRVAERIADKIPLIRPGLKPLANFLDGLRLVRDLRYSLPAFLFIALTMLLWAADYWIVLRGFVPTAALYWGLLSLVGGLIGVALPSSPGALGIFEVSLTLVLTAGGMVRAVAVAYALSLHMLNTLTNTLLGLLGLLSERQSLGSILSAAQDSEKP